MGGGVDKTTLIYAAGFNKYNKTYVALTYFV